MTTELGDKSLKCRGGKCRGGKYRTLNDQYWLLSP